MSYIENWPKLETPPVIVALFQLRFKATSLGIESFLSVDNDLKKILPKRVDNVQANINIPSSYISLGITKVTGTSEAHICSYTYLSETQKTKFIIEEGCLTYVSEDLPYAGWENFENSVKGLLNLCSKVLDGTQVSRTSIRFVNKFEFDKFDDPTQYFKTLVSSAREGSFEFPITNYGFKLTMDVREGVYAIVNQNLGKPSERYIYLFDIDVLDKNKFFFDADFAIGRIKLLREDKNKIFFGNVTQQLLDLCN